MMRNYLYRNMNRSCVNEVHGSPCAYRFNGGHDDHLRKPISLRDIRYYNEPLIIYDTYRHKCYNARVVFPPFSDYTIEEEANVCGVGTYTFTSGGVIDLFRYILDNHRNVEDFGFRNIHNILYIIRANGWEYTATLYGEQFTNIKTGKVVFGFRNVFDIIQTDYEFNLFDDLLTDEYYND